MARLFFLLPFLLIGGLAHADGSAECPSRQSRTIGDAAMQETARTQDSGKMEQAMTQALQYQIRMRVSQALADAYREKRETPALSRVRDVLRSHRASFTSQYDAFAGYVAEAERCGVQDYPLYQWTLDTIRNPEKQAKYRRVFTVYVDDKEVYDEQVADALRAELSALGEAAGILGVDKFDTNPAHNPQPPSRG